MQLHVTGVQRGPKTRLLARLPSRAVSSTRPPLRGTRSAPGGGAPQQLQNQTCMAFKARERQISWGQG